MGRTGAERLKKLVKREQSELPGPNRLQTLWIGSDVLNALQEINSEKKDKPLDVNALFR